ncbi:hypothetical protein ACT3TS_15875 [Specibacter sp. AOP5-B1-6]|uniref:hypothetical protein n=1 Tax=Specibacter sp. AOP5-B1-6 TaxID=3457653 RepID=UPI00402BB0D0
MAWPQAVLALRRLPPTADGEESAVVPGMANCTEGGESSEEGEEALAAPPARD